MDPSAAPSLVPGLSPTPSAIPVDGLSSLVNFYLGLRHHSLGVFAFVGIALWVAAAACYFTWWAWPIVARRLGFTGRLVARRTSASMRRRHLVPTTLPDHVMCDRCHSIYRSALGACYSCGAPIAEATALPARGPAPSPR